MPTFPFTLQQTSTHSYAHKFPLTYIPKTLLNKGHIKNDSLYIKVRHGYTTGVVEVIIYNFNNKTTISDIVMMEQYKDRHLLWTIIIRYD